MSGDIGEQVRAAFLALIMVLSVMAVGVAFTGSGAAASADIVVDADGSGDYESIQNAVENASQDNTIRVKSGTYDEQVVISKDLTIVADDGAVLKWTNNPGSSFADNSYLVVNNGATVTLDGLEFQGPFAGAGTSGIFITSDATVTATDLTMTKMYVDNGGGEPSGVQYHSAIVVGDKRYTDSPRAGTLSLSDSTIDEFGKSAMTVTGPNSAATVTNVSVSGSGVLDPNTNGANPAQDTFLLDGGSLVLEDSSVSNVWYDGSFTAGTGVSVYGPAQNVEIRNNEFTSVAKPISLQAYRDFDNTAGTISGVAVENNVISGHYQAVDVYSESISTDTYVLNDSTISGNTFSDGNTGIAAMTGQTDNVTVASNVFDHSNFELWQQVETFDRQAVLANNDLRGGVTIASGVTIHSSIQSAVDAASSGDTIRVEPGTYEENVTVETANLTLKGPNAGTPGDANRGPEATIVGQVILTGDNVVLDGFDISPKPASSNQDAEAVRVSNTPDDVVVRNNIVRDFDGSSLPEWEGLDGINVFGGKGTDAIENVTITANKVENLEGRDTKGGVAGISIQGNVNGATVTNNDLHNVGNASTAWGFGIVVRGTGNHGVTPTNVTVDGNDIDSVVSNPATATVGVGLGLESGTADDVQFTTNDISNTGFLLEDKTATVDLSAFVANNTIDRGALLENASFGGDTRNVIFNHTQDAVDAAEDGDTIQVTAGTYHESVTVDTSNLTLAAADGTTPTIVGDGSSVGSQPHAAIHVTGNPAATNVTIEGLRVRNPTGHYGIYAGEGGSNSDVDGLVVRDTVIEDVATDLDSHDPLAGSVAGLYVRAEYDSLTVVNNTVRNVNTVGDQWQNAVGISFSSFIGDEAFAGGGDSGSETAENTTVRNNSVTNITGAKSSRTKGIAASGEFDGLTFVDNTIRNISANTSDSAVFGIELTENPGKAGSDIDEDGTNERIGPRNFKIRHNDISQLSGSAESLIFIGGYEDLGDRHVIERNSLRDAEAGVWRYAQNQPGFNPGDQDTLDATLNWWGSDAGPNTEDGAAVSGHVDYDPFLTVPPAELEGDEWKTAYGHNMVIPADGNSYTVAFPAPVNGTVSEVFGDVTGNVFAYDGSEWKTGQEIADEEIDALDAFIVSLDNGTEEMRISFEYKEDDSVGPSMTAHELEAGWNFIGAPHLTSSEDAFSASTAPVNRVVRPNYPVPSLLPYHMTGATGLVNPSTVSPFQGYWVYANEDGDIGMAGTLPVDPAVDTEQQSLNQTA